MKNFILTTLIVLMSSVSSFANGIKEWESFRRMSYDKQVEVIDKIQQLAVSIESTQRKLIRYDVTKQERNKLQQSLDKMLFVMNKIFIAEAHAEDYAKTCIFAGWLADYSKYGKVIYCDIASIKSRSNNYKTNFLTNKDKAPTNQCNKPNQVPCQPMLFGTDSNGKLFCVDRSTAGTYYTNASANCRDLSKKANNYGEIIKNIIKNPKDFLELLKAIQKLCLCDVDGPQNSNEYRKIILKDGTCRSLVQQLKNLFASTDYTKLNLTCSAEEIDLSSSLKEVMPVVNAFDMNKKFLDERKRICDGNVTIIVTPTVTPTSTPTATPTSTPTATPTSAPTATPTSAPTATPTSAPTATPTSAPTVTPTSSPDVNTSISISLGDPNYSESNTAEVKITAITCPGIKLVEDIGKIPDCEVNWFLKSVEDKVDAKNTTEEEKKKVDENKENKSEDDKKKSELTANNDFGSSDEQDKNTISKTITLKDKEQIITVELTYKNLKASSSQTIKKQESSEETPTPTPTPTVSPSPSPTPAEEEESDPIPPQQQPQIPLGIPEQPMLLPGVI
jgi:hypothetical protein